METSPRYRYRATPAVAEAIADQGRLRNWIARRIGCGPSGLTRILAGDRMVDEERGRALAALVDLPFDRAFAGPSDRWAYSFGPKPPRRRKESA